MGAFDFSAILENCSVHIHRMDEALAREKFGDSYGVDRHNIQKNNDWPFLSWHVAILPIRRCSCCSDKSYVLQFDGHSESFAGGAQEAWDRMEKFGLDKVVDCQSNTVKRGLK